VSKRAQLHHQMLSILLWTMNHLSGVSRKLSACFVDDSELVPCLTERQRSYIKWRSTRTSRSVRYFLTLTLLTGSIEIGWQVTNYREIFETGSLPLTHEKITTLLASRTTKGRRRGSSKATLMGRLRCIWRCRGEGWISHVCSSSMARTRQPGTITGGLRCIGQCKARKCGSRTLTCRTRRERDCPGR
jgi:hypothetical protein